MRAGARFNTPLVSGNGPGLGSEGNGSGVAEGDGQAGENRHVHVKRHAVDPANAEGQECPFVLQPAELTRCIKVVRSSP